MQLKVLDLATFVAAPLAATLLADLGAEVVKVEQPGRGDVLRHIGPGIDGTSYLWLIEGRNKRSVTIDLRRGEGQELVRRLADWADVLVENFRPGTMQGWGLGYEALSARNPRLVYVSVSGFGQTGPKRELGGFDRVAQAFGGLAYVTGFPERDPVRCGYSVADYSTGVFAALGALEAVRRRDAPGGTGRGEWVDLALYEGMVRISEFTFAEHAASGAVRQREGNRSVASAPSDVYRTRDGAWVTLSSPSDALFARLVAALGRPELAERPEYATAPSRVEHAEELEEVVRAWVAGRDRETVLQVMGDAGVPAAALNSVADLVQHPHVRARGNVVEVPAAGGQAVPMQGVVPRLVREPGEVRWAGEPLGASTRTVLAGTLGLDEAEIERLAAEGVV